MRFHEGDFAYDIEPQRDPSTQLLSAWRFTVFRLRPTESIVIRGEARTREEAEGRAREALAHAGQKPPGRAA
jgi:hypothetical protein